MNSAITAVNILQRFPSQDQFGLLTQLYNQPGNRSTNILQKCCFNGKITGGTYQGVWSAALTYAKNDRVNYPNGSTLYWRALSAISSGGAAPYTRGASSYSYNTSWALDIGMEMVQDSGNGVNFFRYALGFNDDDWIRLRSIEYGTISTSIQNLSFVNHTNYQLSTSVSSIAVPTVHPTSRTFTMGTGLSVANSASIGSSVTSLTIPTTVPTSVLLTIDTGLSITVGETLTIQNSASNLFVIIVVSYNSSTGSLTGRSVVKTGSGTFSSWTIKRERLLTIRNSATTYFSGLVQTYDSVTGSTTVNSVSNTSAGTLSSWTILDGLGRHNDPGADTDNSFQVFGQYIFGTVIGTAVRLKHIKTSAGMGMRFVYLSGPNVGQADAVVDTYNASTLTNQTTTAWSDLSYGTHFFAVIADTSPSGASTNTLGWFKSSLSNDNSKTFAEAVTYDIFTNALTIGLAGDSLGELAYNFRDSNPADSLNWVPDHNGVLTCVGRNRTYLIDGVSVDTTTISSALNPSLYEYQSFNSASLIQTVAVVHPQASGDMASINSTHTLNNEGVYYDVLLQWLQDAFISAGYNNMVTLGDTFFQKIKTGLGEYINRPGEGLSVNMTASQIDLPDYLFYSTSASAPQRDIVLGMYMVNYFDAWRTGQANRGTSFVQDFSGATGAKFYPYVYNGKTISQGEQQRLITKLYAGNWLNANSQL